ncbi:MAG: radical SAM protein [Elusimicrobia bacterium]|nr:radical SAM protein [Elusimicrobiota bacterium]
MKPSRLAFSFSYSLQQAFSGLSELTGLTLHKPSRVIFENSSVCNLRCGYCDFWRDQVPGGALSTGEWISLLERIRAWAPGFVLGLGYAEPFAEASTLPILRAAKRLGVPAVCSTNGTLVDHAKAVEICAAGLNNIYVSLDSLRPEVHDGLRGVPGTQAKALLAIRHLLSNRSRPAVYATAVITAANLEELPALAAWAADAGLDGISFQAMMRRGSAKDALWPGAKACAAIDRLMAAKRAGAPVRNSMAQLKNFKCYYSGLPPAGAGAACAAFRMLKIKRNGEVRFCVPMGGIGNAMRADLPRLWRSEAADAVRRGIRRCSNSGCRLLNCHATSSLGTRAKDAVNFLRGRR